ncbi:MAG: mannose-1-phosphate guanylyltransferase [Cognaticolwellia sp.]|jgi:mannose-1-phosphate guanylyltransferase
MRGVPRQGRRHSMKLFLGTFHANQFFQRFSGPPNTESRHGCPDPTCQGPSPLIASLMPAQAFLLAAGFGTRLRPLTLHRPKPLVPVCGVPMLDYALALARLHGAEEVVVNAHYLPDQIQTWAAQQHQPVHVNVETPEILGTGGGLKAVQDLLEERFVVVNGDILCDVDLAALMEDLDQADASMALRTLALDESYGNVSTDQDSTVVDLVGLATAEPTGEVDSSRHFTGVHALRRAALDRVPEGTACIIRTAYCEMVPEKRVRGIPHDGTWFDVGTPQAYLQANLMAVRGELPLPLDPHTRAYLWLGAGTTLERDGAKLIGPLWLGQDVTLGAGSVIGPDVVLGDGAVIGEGATLVRSVVWDGAELAAGASLQDAIVYDGGTLEIGL